MAKKAANNPNLPRANDSWGSSLINALMTFLTDLARRANETLARDGTEPMEGPLNMNGFGITGAGPVTGGAGTFTSLGVSGNITVGGTVDGVDVSTLPGLIAANLANTKVTVFTSNGTFTPDPNMTVCEVTAWGGGGAGGGSPATGVGQVSVGAGGSAGAKAWRRLTAAQIGASQAVTIGAGGTGVSGASGNNGGNTTLGALVSARGGEGGFSGTVAASNSNAVASTPTQSAVGDIRGWTSPSTSAAIAGGAVACWGTSGQNDLGGGIPGIGATIGNGTNANANTGAGGGSPLAGASTVARTGGTGGSGLMVILEYLHT